MARPRTLDCDEVATGVVVFFLKEGFDAMSNTGNVGARAAVQVITIHRVDK